MILLIINEKADKFLSILVLVGSVNIPIIKMSVEWWSTLHQPASITISEKPAIDLDHALSFIWFNNWFYWNSNLPSNSFI